MTAKRNLTVPWRARMCSGSWRRPVTSAGEDDHLLYTEENYTAISAGELAVWICAAGVSRSPPLLLLSLGTALLAWLLALASLDSVVSLFTSPLTSTPLPFGVRQEGTFHMTPVKLFSWKPLRSHLLHGLPVRSSARRLALIAPWFAFGFTFWLVTGAAPAKGLLLAGSPFESSPLIPFVSVAALMYVSIWLEMRVDVSQPAQPGCERAAATCRRED